MTEKKEIGMEKLIRYLLESKGEEYKEEYYEWYRDVELEQNIDNLSELKLFIKWLVENDKIDFEEYADEWRDSNINNNADFFQLYKHYDMYECVLMILAISDEPIEFLISILK